MKKISEQKDFDPGKLDFLMEVEYLMQQMANAHIPLGEGYEKLMKLISRHQDS
jgi:hypothetical protein